MPGHPPTTRFYSLGDLPPSEQWIIGSGALKEVLDNPMGILAAYVAGGFILLPVTLIHALTGVLFPFPQGVSVSVRLGRVGSECNKHLRPGSCPGKKHSSQADRKKAQPPEPQTGEERMGHDSGSAYPALGVVFRGEHYPGCFQVRFSGLPGGDRPRNGPGHTSDHIFSGQTFSTDRSADMD